MNQPAKWNGHQVTPRPTRWVTIAFMRHTRPFGISGPRDMDPVAVADATLGGIGRIDLDEHVLLQLGEPLVGARLFTAAFVFDEPTGGEDQRKLLGNTILHGCLERRNRD